MINFYVSLMIAISIIRDKILTKKNINILIGTTSTYVQVSIRVIFQLFLSLLTNDINIIK